MTTKLAVPETADGLRETLMDRSKLKTLIDEGSFPEFMTKYQQEFGKANVDVDEQVKSQIDQALANFARENLVELRRARDGRPATAADVKAQKQAGTFHNKFAVGKPLDGKFEDFMDFMKVVDHRADPRDPRIAEKRQLLENAMSSTDPASGGFLIPEEYRSTLMSVALESAVVRPRARVIPMQSLRISMPMVDSTTNNGSVYGGVIAYWTEEGAALVQSQPQFARVTLEAKKLTAYTEVPNELRRDSAVSVEALLNDIFPQAIAWFEDLAFMTGTGVGEPLGIFNTTNTATITQTAEAGQAAGTIVWENIVNMYARMLPTSLGSAVWIVSPDTLPQLMTTALNIGTGGAPVGMALGAGGPQLTLLGRPVIITEKVSARGTVGDINFVDFSQYLIGDRMAMEAETSTEYRFGNDMTAYRFIERVDGRPWVQSAITPRNGGPTLSPFVNLATRA